MTENNAIEYNRNTTLALGIIISAISSQLDARKLLIDIEVINKHLMKKDKQKYKGASELVSALSETIKASNLL